MKFKGDIIITDPCYIMPPTYDESIKREDFCPLEVWNRDYKLPKTQEEQDAILAYHTAIKESEKLHKDIWRNGSIDLEDGNGLKEYGFTNYIWGSTLYGDWSCTTFVDSPDTVAMINEMGKNYISFFNGYNFSKTSPEQKAKLLEEYKKLQEEYKRSPLILGQFCADAGLVGCFLLEEVLAFNPTFNYHIEKPWTTTWIKDFDGDVEYRTNVASTGDYMASLVGTGNINFYTQQTGF